MLLLDLYLLRNGSYKGLMELKEPYFILDLPLGLNSSSVVTKLALTTALCS